MSELPDVVLARAADLFGRLDDVTLETIDGEFYWRCCRRDFVAAVAIARDQIRLLDVDLMVQIRQAFEAARHELPETRGDAFRTVWERIVVDPRHQFPDIPAPDTNDPHQVDAILEDLHKRYGVPQQLALAHLCYDDPIPYGGYAITIHSGLDWNTREPYDTLYLRVRSASWKGCDVEQTIRTWYRFPHDQYGTFDPLPEASNLPEGWADVDEYVAFLSNLRAFLDDQVSPRFKQPQATIRLSFDLVESEAAMPDRASDQRVGFIGPTGQFVVPFGDVRPPFIAVVVGLPLPPKGTIAREYDALVRGDYQWHRQLPGTANRQYKETAIRTWAVSLLVAAGVPVDDAMMQVSAALGLAGIGEITTRKFNDDRRLLIQRVPEAEDYLYLRKARTAKT